MYWKIRLYHQSVSLSSKPSITNAADADEYEEQY